MGNFSPEQINDGFFKISLGLAVGLGLSYGLTAIFSNKESIKATLPNGNEIGIETTTQKQENKKKIEKK